MKNLKQNKTVPDDDLHPNVIPFISTQTYGPPPIISKNDVPFRSNDTTSLFARNHASFSSPQPLPSHVLPLTSPTSLPPPPLPPAPPPPPSPSSSLLLSMAQTPTKSFAIPTHTTTISSKNHSSVQEGFLVWSPSCQIPATNPLAADVMKLFRRGNHLIICYAPIFLLIAMNNFQSISHVSFVFRFLSI